MIATRTTDSEATVLDFAKNHIRKMIKMGLTPEEIIKHNRETLTNYVGDGILSNKDATIILLEISKMVSSAIEEEEQEGK